MQLHGARDTCCGDNCVLLAYVVDVLHFYDFESFLYTNLFSLSQAAVVPATALGVPCLSSLLIVLFSSCDGFNLGWFCSSSPEQQGSLSLSLMHTHIYTGGWQAVPPRVALWCLYNDCETQQCIPQVSPLERGAQLYALCLQQSHWCPKKEGSFPVRMSTTVVWITLQKPQCPADRHCGTEPRFAQTKKWFNSVANASCCCRRWFIGMKEWRWAIISRENVAYMT